MKIKIIYALMFWSPLTFADIQLRPGGSVTINAGQSVTVTCIGQAPARANCSMTDRNIFNSRGERIFFSFDYYDVAAEAARLVQAGVCRF